MAIKEKTETIKSKGFTLSYSDIEGIILDHRYKNIRCFIKTDSELIEFRKYINYKEHLVCCRFRSEIDFCKVNDKFFFEVMERSFLMEFKKAIKEL